MMLAKNTATSGAVIFCGGKKISTGDFLGQGTYGAVYRLENDISPMHANTSFQHLYHLESMPDMSSPLVLKQMHGNRKVNISFTRQEMNIVRQAARQWYADCSSTWCWSDGVDVTPSTCFYDALEEAVLTKTREKALEKVSQYHQSVIKEASFFSEFNPQQASHVKVIVGDLRIYEFSVKKSCFKMAEQPHDIDFSLSVGYQKSIAMIMPYLDGIPFNQLKKEICFNKLPTYNMFGMLALFQAVVDKFLVIHDAGNLHLDANAKNFSVDPRDNSVHIYDCGFSDKNGANVELRYSSHHMPEYREGRITANKEDFGSCIQVQKVDDAVPLLYAFISFMDEVYMQHDGQSAFLVECDNDSEMNLFENIICQLDSLYHLFYKPANAYYDPLRMISSVLGIAKRLLDNKVANMPMCSNRKAGELVNLLALLDALNLELKDQQPDSPLVMQLNEFTAQLPEYFTSNKSNLNNDVVEFATHVNSIFHANREISTTSADQINSSPEVSM